jgi:TolB protein
VKGGKSSIAVAFLLIAAVLLAPGTAGAILYIDINAPGGKRMPIALPDILAGGGDRALSAALPKVVAGDLAMTSLFDIVPRDAHLERILPAHFAGKPLSFPDWKLIGAEAVVIGRVERGKGDEIVVELRLYDATLGAMMAGKKYTGPASRYREIAHKFANEILYAFTGVRGIFDTEIAYTAGTGRGREKELFVIGLDGQFPRKLTEYRSFTLFPRWAPDGRSIAYTSFRTGVPVIYLRNLLTGSDRAVVKFGNTKSPGCFSVKGDALYVSVSVGGDSDIYRVPLNSGDHEKVVGGYGLEVSPSLSPDGRQLAFVSNRGGSPQVYVKDLSNGKERRISSGLSYATSPSWSPAGEQIAFTGLAGGKFALYTVSSDGSGQRLLASADGDCLDPSFSPDGRYLVYTYSKKSYSELKIISADGRWGRTLFSGPSGIGSPVWSPGR